jgi:hypothetical protein
MPDLPEAAECGWNRKDRFPVTDKRTPEYYRERRRLRAEAEGRTYIPKRPAGSGRPKRVPRWTPGTPIEVEEIEEL